MRINAVGLASSSERCATTVMVESILKMSSQVNLVDADTPMQISAQLLKDGAKITNAQILLSVMAPLKSLAATMTPAVVLRARQADQHPINAGQPPMIPTVTHKYRLKPNQDGIFQIELPPQIIDGIYKLTLEATGSACGGQFQRHATQSVYLGSRKALYTRPEVAIPATPILTKTTNTVPL